MIVLTLDCLNIKNCLSYDAQNPALKDRIVKEGVFYKL